MIWRVFIAIALLVVAIASLLTGRRAQDVASPAVQVQPPQPGYYMSTSPPHCADMSARSWDGSCVTLIP